ncbi:MAG: hypothetical protein CMB20_001275 [Methanobacteriota archaeon]|nr:MAG: hypothetical protein CMB20_001275 [Euryarchaeota archaeon]|tara:strand:+ start:13 stop:1035 length:1023 start_codon:yes stop_codon:yes gene_type:complete
MADIVLKQTSSGGVIQEMDSSDKDYIEHVILTDFNSLDSGVGTLAVNPASTSGLTLIGSFVDTKRPDAVGTHPVGTSVTTVSTFNFYQDLQSASESITNAIRPVALDDSANIQRMSDSEVNDDFIFSTQQNLYGSGVGSYKLQPSAPTDGTWVSKGTITDTKISGGTNTSQLWRKSAPASTPTTVRPLKFVVSSGSLREMTDTEIKKFTPRLRNRIVANGIGTYKVQANAPTSGGTWVQMGDTFTDTRHQVANQSYTSSFSNTFTNTFTNTFAGFFSSTYNRFQAFTGSFIGSFSGSRTKFFTGTFTGTFTGFFTGSFTGLTVQSSTENVSSAKLWVRVA